jgi:hypothetical protein
MAVMRQNDTSVAAVRPRRRRSLVGLRIIASAISVSATNVIAKPMMRGVIGPRSDVESDMKLAPPFAPWINHQRFHACTDRNGKRTSW